jgi:hypothetical protein
LVTVYLFPRVAVRMYLACSTLREYWWTAACSKARCLRLLRLSSADAFRYSGVKISEIVMATAPAFLIEKFGDIQDVAEFGAHLRIAIVPNLIVVSVLPIFWSDLTNRFACGGFQEAKRLYYFSLGAVMLGFGGWALCIGLASRLVSEYLFAGKIAFHWVTMGWLLAYYLVQTLAQIAQTVANSRSRFGITLGLSIGCAVTCLCFAVGLSNWTTGMVAVLSGFTLSWLLAGFLPGHYFVCSLIRLSPKNL